MNGATDLRLPSPLSRTPLGVWGATALLAGLLLLGSFIQPLLHIPDERYHIDMILAAFDGGGWPSIGERDLSTEIAAAGRILRRDVRDESFALPPRPRGSNADDMPAACWPTRPMPECSFKPTFGELRDTYDFQGKPNRMAQHPPAYYLLIGGLTSTFTVLTMTELPFDAQIWLYRLATILLILPVPFLISQALRDLDFGSGAQVSGALLPLTIVGLTFRNGPIVNNDNLLLVLTVALVALLVRLQTHGVCTRRLVYMGVVLGLAILTKGFALLTALSLPLALFLVISATGWRSRLLSTAKATSVVALVSLISGGWWPIRNIVIYGTPQPAGASRPPASGDFAPDLSEWSSVYMKKLVVTAFGRFGNFLLFNRVALFCVVLLLILATVIGSRRLGWELSLAMNLPLLLALLGWGMNVYIQYTKTGVIAATNARYFYPYVLGVSVVSAAAMFQRHEQSNPRLGRLWPAIVSGAAVLVSLLEGLHRIRIEWSDVGALQDGLATLRLWSPVPFGLFNLGLLFAMFGVILVIFEVSRRNLLIEPFHGTRL